MNGEYSIEPNDTMPISNEEQAGHVSIFSTNFSIAYPDGRQFRQKDKFLLLIFQVKAENGIKPVMFKNLIGRGHPEFSGKQQQDAQVGDPT